MPVTLTGRTLDDARRWTAQGTTMVTTALQGLDEAAFDAPTALPGWTRRHLVAHLAANADAIGRLVHWAATGEPTPMYSSPEQRAADLEAGSRLPGPELVAWFHRSAEALGNALVGLTATQWQTEVVTAQGRTVPAAETPWMRAREVLVHAVDLGTGITFDDLPADFLAALCDDITGKRGHAAGTPASGPALDVGVTDSSHRWQVAGTGEPVLVTGSLAAVAGYLAGRGQAGVNPADGTPLPTLPAWL